MDSRNRKILTAVLIVVALIPWVFDIARIFFTSIGFIQYSAPYASIAEARNEVISWKPIWHVIVLVGFLIFLFRTQAIGPKRKPAWLFGLLFLWPVVAVLFVYETLWKTNGGRPQSSAD